jgi:uncharacterized protein YciI
MADTKHWLYRLRLVDPSRLTAGFSTADTETMTRHREYLRELTEAGTVVLAGRTDAGEQTFGVVILQSTDEATAQKLMDCDPAIAEGLMTAELFPFMLAFLAQTADALL